MTCQAGGGRRFSREKYARLKRVRRPKAFEFQVDDPSQAEAEKTQLCRRDANRLNRPTPPLPPGTPAGSCILTIVGAVGNLRHNTTVRFTVKWTFGHSASLA